jgi:hypothetical protein
MPCRLFYLLSHVIVAVEVEDVCYEVERILVILDFGVEACEVETVGKVLFVNLTEVFVPSRRYELGRC